MLNTISDTYNVNYTGDLNITISIRIGSYSMFMLECILLEYYNQLTVNVLVIYFTGFTSNSQHDNKAEEQIQNQQPGTNKDIKYVI